MPTPISAIETIARRHLLETVPNFWTSSELTDLAIVGIRDLWRDIVDLKQEHYLTVNTTDVSLEASTDQLSGVPTDVHKVYLIEPHDLSVNSSNHGLLFKPLDYNHNTFQLARSKANIDPSNDTIYYAIHQQGAPVSAPTILVAPKVSSRVALNFCYCPTLGQLSPANNIPIPGEADNAIVAWTVAYARAKEREDRSPDPSWLAVYETEKQHLLQSLGLRQYQEPIYADAIWSEYW